MDKTISFVNAFFEIALTCLIRTGKHRPNTRDRKFNIISFKIIFGKKPPRIYYYLSH